MGRTVHYRTKQAAAAEELKVLQRIVEKYNNEFKGGHERIKIWSSAGDPFLKGVIWGFTKVADDSEAKRVLRAVTEMSETTPELTWLVRDEGELTDDRELVLERGKPVKSPMLGT